MTSGIMARFGELFLLVLVIASARSERAATINGFNQFGMNLYKTARDVDPTKNLILSPLSIETALGLLLMGANATTAEQIVRGLHLQTNDLSELASNFHNALKSYSSGDLFKMINKLYVAEEYELKERFSTVARDSFNSAAENVNFKDGSQAAEQINTWVENETNHKIKELFTRDDLTADTLMVLVNAVHFKAAWEDPFSMSSTRLEDFWVSETESKKVQTMNGMNLMHHGKNADLDANVGLIPYQNNKAHFLVVVPNARTGLTELENKLQSYNFSQITNNLEQDWTLLQLPKFNFDTSLDLADVLSKMGMDRMFSENAEFPNMINIRKPIKVDKAVHKAFVSVDEEGTEAAAATGFKLIPERLPPVFVVDRPFFFAIVLPNAVSFMGSVRTL